LPTHCMPRRRHHVPPHAAHHPFIQPRGARVPSPSHRLLHETNDDVFARTHHGAVVAKTRAARGRRAVVLGRLGAPSVVTRCTHRTSTTTTVTAARRRTPTPAHPRPTKVAEGHVPGRRRTRFSCAVALLQRNKTTRRAPSQRACSVSLRRHGVGWRAPQD